MLRQITKMKTKKTVSKRRASPAKRKLISAKKAKKRSTRQARPIHKKILLHPITVMVLLCAAVFIAGWTYEAIADSYTVSAAIMAPALNDGAVITDPADNTTVSSSQIAINGSCEYKSYIKLYRNGLFAGVALCGTDGAFHFTVDLLEGGNSIQTQAYNITDMIGPTTPTITVNYVKPIPPKPTSSLSTTPNNPSTSGDKTPGIVANGPPLLLTSDFKYKTFTVGFKYDWSLDIEGGKPPYKVHIEWGDGSISDMTFPIDPVFHINHTYKKSGYYAVRLRVTDANGEVRIIQLAALIHQPGSATILGDGSSSTGSKKNSASASGIGTNTSTGNSVLKFFNLTSTATNAKKYLWVLWPSLLIVILMVLSFWLGERQEYQDLLARHRAKKRRKHRVSHARH